MRARQSLPRFVPLSTQMAMPAGKPAAQSAPMNGQRSI
jgi:hypothetical protein